MGKKKVLKGKFEMAVEDGETIKKRKKGLEEPYDEWVYRTVLESILEKYQEEYNDVPEFDFKVRVEYPLFKVEFEIEFGRQGFSIGEAKQAIIRFVETYSPISSVMIEFNDGEYICTEVNSELIDAIEDDE